jgi:hypothetical protein
MELLGDLGQIEAHFGPFFEIVTQDRGAVCAERAIDSEIILGAPDGTSWCRGSSRSTLDPFGDSVNLVP